MPETATATAEQKMEIVRPEEMPKEPTAQERVASRILELKAKVAEGTATTDDREDLKLLTA